MSSSAAVTVPEPPAPRPVARSSSSRSSGASDWASLDPLDEDGASEDLVAVSRRGLVRLALVASETGARFQRECVGHDPMAWMLAPRRLFDGATALDACVGREACLRSVLLHGLGLGLDAEATDLDSLIGDDGPDGAAPAPDRRGGAPGPERGGRPARLFTAIVVERDANGTVHSFDAAVLSSADEMRERIAARLGVEVAAGARVAEGFVRSAMSDAFVSDALASTLRLVEEDPSSPPAAGLDVVLQQRFAS